MVIGESEATNMPHQPMGAPQASIDNIMSGISNTGTVKMNNHRKKLRQRFDIIKKLGQGTYGKVQLGINKETGQEVAIKTIKKCKIETEADLVRIRREVQIMSSVQHPNIIHIYEVFENREKMVLVMEFAAGGELYDYLSERKVLSEEEARRVFRQISTAVYYCHKHKICHRDLKLENILLDENGNAKIADFGLSNVFDEQRLLATFCGSPLYASPEIVKGTPYQGPEVDCWSLGVLLYTLVYGAMPFDGSNFKRLVKQISAGDYYEPKKPSPASPLIKEMLTVCPKRRATIEQICNHWWVNTGYNESCLDLAEELANQTPVRLDVLLSLAPSAVTSDQLVVPGPIEETKPADRVARSHSVGSIRDMGNTEAERRILDMVAAGGEAALAPSPTRTITPSESPAQPKRKLETTISMENAAGLIKKKEKPTNLLEDMTISPLLESQESPEIEKMDIDLNTARNMSSKSVGAEINEQKIVEQIPEPQDIQKITPAEELPRDVTKDLNKIDEMCNELLNEPPAAAPAAQVAVPEKKKIIKKKIVKPAAADAGPDSTADEKTVTKKSPTKTVKKIVKKVVDPTEKPTGENTSETTATKVLPERKSSLTEESKPAERRKSRVFEAAEKFQNANNQNNDKLKKIIIPGVSVGSFKKEFERKASLTSPPISISERKMLEKRESNSSTEQPSDSRKSSIGEAAESTMTPPPSASAAVLSQPPIPEAKTQDEASLEKMSANELNESESKSSVASFSLEEARRSMENSIALLNQAKTESNKELDQLCAKTENVAVSDDAERLKKLKNAREIISNAIPVGRLGVRKPPVPFGVNGRSSSGSVVPSSTLGDRKPIRSQGSDPSSLRNLAFANSNIDPKISSDRESIINLIPKAVAISSPEPSDTPTTKTSRAEITLKSATLPRRKTTKAEFQLDVQPKAESSMRFQTEMQHQVPDLRSAPIQEHSSPYSPLSVPQRATSVDPQLKKEFVIPIHRPGFAPNSNLKSASVSRQSAIDSDTEQTNAQLQSQLSSSSSSNQPIKKSPREFIIPIAVEGVGYVTPRAGSLEPSESSFNSSATFNRLGRPRRMGSILSDRDSEDESSFQKMHRHQSSIGRESDNDEPRFAMHRLRTTRPFKKIVQDPNDSASSGEDDDEDGFEILTAENLFSTLLSRVRALTNRLNVNNNTGFPSSRFMSNMRQPHSPFWNHDPFTSRLSNGSGPWRHSLARDFGTDMDSMISRSGATLPRGPKTTKINNNNISTATTATIANQNELNDIDTNEKLDLADLDLSRLRLTKKDLETLSSITPELPKHFQDQLLAQLPPNQARKLSRTLSMQNNSATAPVKIYKRSLSGGREPKEFIKVPTSTCCTETKSTTYTEDDNPSFRRSVSRSKDRSASRGLSSDEYNNNSVRSSLSSDIGQYRSCIPSSGDSSISSYDKSKYELSDTMSQYKYYDTLPPRRSCMSPTKEFNGRPPSGLVSPPPGRSDSPPRRRSSQRNISRFLRPDFFDTPREESCYVNNKKQRELDTQAVLREIRERSRERSIDRRDRSTERLCDKSYYSNIDPCIRDRRKSSIPSVRSLLDTTTFTSHMRNRSVDRCLNVGSNFSQQPRSSIPQSNNKPNIKEEPIYSNYCKESKEKNSSFADKILGELQNLSLKQMSKTKDAEVKGAELKENQSDDCILKDKTKVRRNHSGSSNATEKTDDDRDDLSSKTISANDIKMVTSLTNEIDSVSLPKKAADKNEKQSKRSSKLIRPKSYPSKEPDIVKKPSPERMETVKENVNGCPETTICNSKIDACKSERPKSYPYSKITPPKETNKYTKNGTAFAVDKSSSSSGNSVVKIVTSKQTDKDDKKPIESSTDGTATIKKIKIIKKTIKTDGSISQSQAKKQVEIANKTMTEKPIENGKEKVDSPSSVKEKSPEKKTNRGLLYAIGQKFEKLRENTKSKEKKAINKLTKAASSDVSNDTKKTSLPSSVIEKGAIKTEQMNSKNEPTTAIDEKPIERKSRIDAMIRNLRERSLPRGPAMTESGLIKRAVSVEDMTGSTFNRCAVNKVLGLFKKIEKDGGGSKVENTKSSNHIETLAMDTNGRERPKSGGFVSKLKKGRPYTGAKSDSIVMLTDQLQKQMEADRLNGNVPKVIVNLDSKNQNRQSCTTEKNDIDIVTKRHSNIESEQTIQDKERVKNNRRGLVLDFGRLNKIQEPPPPPPPSQPETRSTVNTNYALNSHKTTSNNNYIQHSIGNHNEVLTPSYDSITNYSSDSRSLHDDCASTSTFLSPTDEPELYFDDWSVCSEDNFAGASSTPSMSRLSRNSQAPSPLYGGSGGTTSESVIDRIKRRSFYSRFNENKPKRQQYNGTGTVAREYYRESAAKLKARPPERLTSPSIADYSKIEPYRSHSVTSHHNESSRSLSQHSSTKQSYVDELRNYRPSNYNLPPTCSSSTSKGGHSSTSDYKYKSDYLSLKPTSKSSSIYDTTTPIYGTYTPNRRTSAYSTNGTATTSALDAYATLGKKQRPYNHRSISLLESSSSSCNNSASISSYRKDSRGTPDFGNIIRPNYRMRTPSIPRSPTNI